MHELKKTTNVLDHEVEVEVGVVVQVDQEVVVSLVVEAGLIVVVSAIAVREVEVEVDPRRPPSRFEAPAPCPPLAGPGHLLRAPSPASPRARASAK